MKVLILAGGLGTRISEETNSKLKPMIKVGDYPILWHIMKIYSYYGFREFIILIGYKGGTVKDFFYQKNLNNSHINEDLPSDSFEYITHEKDSWKITLLDTGLNTMTGGRILRAQSLLKNESFLLTYGDGLSNININKLVDFHKENNKAVTLSAVQPPSQFGILKIDSKNNVTSFNEKPVHRQSWINGGFFVCNYDVFRYLKDDQTIFEREPLSKLAEERNLNAFMHQGFWQCMDTLKDKQYLMDQWNSGKAGWKIW